MQIKTHFLTIFDHFLKLYYLHNSPAANHANPAAPLTLRNFFHAKFFSFNYANIVTTSQLNVVVMILRWQLIKLATH